MSLTDSELRQRIESIGAEELGRRYALRTIARLNEMYAAEDARSVEFADDAMTGLISPASTVTN